MQFKTGVDVNGNRVLKVMDDGWRGFSIQTNGKLLRTHRDGIGPWTEGEVIAYVREFGTARQKEFVGI